MPASGSDYPDRDRAACAVGAEKSVTWPGAGGEGKPVDGGDRAVALVSCSASIMSGTLGAGVWPALLSR